VLPLLRLLLLLLLLLMLLLPRADFDTLPRLRCFWLCILVNLADAAGLAAALLFAPICWYVKLLPATLASLPAQSLTELHMKKPSALAHCL
jgi:hypothetical protein